jgi:hypothetical protein
MEIIQPGVDAQRLRRVSSQNEINPEGIESSPANNPIQRRWRRIIFHPSTQGSARGATLG